MRVEKNRRYGQRCILVAMLPLTHQFWAQKLGFGVGPTEGMVCLMLYESLWEELRNST